MKQDQRDAVESLQWSGSPEPLDESVVRWIELRCSHELPALYVYAATRFYDETPRRNWFQVVSPGLTFGASVGVLLDPRQEAADGVRDEWDGMGEYGSDLRVPIAVDGGGDIVCLDYREAARPRVVYFEHEMLDFVELAPDILAFFRLLRVNPHLEDEIADDSE